MTPFAAVFIVVIICWTAHSIIEYITDEVLEQRRRETKTGEFEEDEE